MSVTVTIVSDFVCPWCWIGEHKLYRALDLVNGRAEIGLRWQAYLLNPAMPPEGMDRRAYRTAKFGSWERAQELDAKVTAAGLKEGLEFRYDRIHRTPSTLAAHRLMGLARSRNRERALADALFPAYFHHGRDIGAPAVLADIAAASGLDLDRDQVTAFLAGSAGEEEVRAEYALARAWGIDSVPSFLIGDHMAGGTAEPEQLARLMVLAAREAEAEARAGG